VNKAFL